MCWVYRFIILVFFYDFCVPEFFLDCNFQIRRKKTRITKNKGDSVFCKWYLGFLLNEEENIFFEKHWVLVLFF